MPKTSQIKPSKKYQIFVSSTYNDLIDERKEITQAILKCDCIPAGMELWPASNLSQWEVIKSVIDDSDYYLLIIAGRYGTEEVLDEQGNYVSYTEMEYDYAVKTGKPVIALVHKHPEQLPGNKIELDQEKRDKLEQFKRKVMHGRMVTFWTSIADLKTEAVLAIKNAVDCYPAEGWIKASGSASKAAKVYYFRMEGLGNVKEVAEALSQGNVVITRL